MINLLYILKFFFFIPSKNHWEEKTTKKKILAEPSFDLGASRLWASHSSAELLSFWPLNYLSWSDVHSNHLVYYKSISTQVILLLPQHSTLVATLVHIPFLVRRWLHSSLSDKYLVNMFILEHELKERLLLVMITLIVVPHTFSKRPVMDNHWPCTIHR